MAFTRDSTLGTVLDHADAAVVVRRFAPGVVNSPLLVQLRSAPLGLVIGMDPLLKTDPAREESFWSALGAVDDSGVAAPRPERVAVVPRDDYDDAPRSSARLRAALRAPCRRPARSSSTGPRTATRSSTSSSRPSSGSGISS
ncbi:hypothetical protein Q0F99_11960 [Rathayibacter oskolensis]|uniref:hypothetical protein n=1 Tax=Rathayibacter oskolensis TaxID=1891671 RepID=UPI00265FBE27|nr:hypothetical protein [Rathayibacter oskolensis]WKK70568.1 hypothetical protein Q0F99_11960 [Rathayibacter oskolensis]